ncbi:MAG: hypothetical protein AAF149_24125 [Bacteroidota bacterium]
MKDKDLDKLFQEASKKAIVGDSAAGWSDMKLRLKEAGIAPAPRRSWFNLNSILLILLLLMVGAGSVMYFVNDNSATGSQQLASKEVSSSDKHNTHGQNTSSNVDRNLDSIVDPSDSEEGSSADQLTDNEEIKASISTSDSEEKSHLSSEQLSQLNSSSEFNSKSDEQLASIGHIEGHDGQSISDQSNPAELAGTKADLDDSEQNSLLSQGKGSETELENSKSDVIIATDNVSKEDSSGFMVDDLSSALPDNEITENKLNEEDKTILVTGNPEDGVIITNESDMNKKSLLIREQSSQLDSSSEFNAKSNGQSASIVQIEGRDSEIVSNQSNPAELAGTRADLDDSERNSSLSLGKESETELENSKSDVVIATDNVSKEDSSGFMVDKLPSALPDNEITENRLNEEDKTILVTDNPEDDVIITNESSDDLEDQTTNVSSDNSQSPKGFEESGADNESDKSKYTYYAGPSLLLPINITFSYLPTLPNHQLAKVNPPDPSKPADQEENFLSRSRWSIGLEFSPDLSTVGLRGVDDPGYTVGLHAEYHLSSRLSISGGVSYSKKIYFADEDIGSYPGSNPNWTLERVDGNCDVIDVPINLSYYLKGYDQSGFVFSGGLSTYFMLTEDYDIIYNGPWPDGSQFVRNENQHFLGILNVSVGYRKRLSPILSLQAEPFIKIPVQGIGAGDLDLYTSGIRFILKYNRTSLSRN